MNQFNGIGRLCKDVEVKESKNGKKYVKNTLAINDGFGENERCFFIPITIFGNVVTCLNKGSKIGITGKLETYTYEVDGETKYGFGIVCFNIDLLDSKKTEDLEDAPF